MGSTRVRSACQLLKNSPCGEILPTCVSTVAGFVAPALWQHWRGPPDRLSGWSWPQRRRLQSLLTFSCAEHCCLPWHQMALTSPMIYHGGCCWHAWMMDRVIDCGGYWYHLQTYDGDSSSLCTSPVGIEARVLKNVQLNRLLCCFISVVLSLALALQAVISGNLQFNINCMVKADYLSFIIDKLQSSIHE